MTSETVGNIVGVLQIRDEASGVIGTFNSAANSLFGTLQQLGGGFSDFGNIAQAAFSGFATGGPVGAALGGATAVIGETVDYMKKSVDAAAQSQAAFTSLGSAVERSGTSWATVEAATRKALSALEATSTFSNIELVGALQRLMATGLSYDQAIQALKASTDFASAAHLDLDRAAKIVALGLEGNSSMLKRYGVDLQTTAAVAKIASEDMKILTAAVGSIDPSHLVTFSAALKTVEETTGPLGIKTVSVKEAVAGLNQALKDGKISGQEYADLTATLGVKFDATKLTAASFDSALATLNTRFGGDAAKQASTYAGTQERLNSAMTDLSVTVGNLVLPALTGLTQAMIPVVQGLQQGVDSIGAWLGEVAKIPAVKSTIDFLSEAFNNFFAGLGKAWDEIITILGPALKELGDAFAQIWDALKPLGDAFKELMDAFGAGGGDIDPLKILLEGLVLVIKGLAELIRLSVPVIRAFAEGFKEAADIIAPPLKWLADNISGFIKWLTGAFQGFYDWLVGHSLWQDLWKALETLAADAVERIIGNIGNTFFESLKTGFQTMGSAVQTAFGDLWNGLEAAAVQMATTVINSLESTFFQPLQSAFTAATEAVAKIWDAFHAYITDGITTLKTNLTSAQTFLQQTFSNMQSTASSALSTLSNMVNSTLSSIAAAANNLWNTLTHHSIWPNMLDEMVAQTAGAMANIQDAFTTGFQGPRGILATVQSAQPILTAGSSSAGIATPAAPQISVTVPVQVTLDSVPIAAVVQQKIITNLRTKTEQR